MDYIAVPVDLIYKTPNDMMLGEIVRQMYYETKAGDSVAEHMKHESSNDTELRSVQAS